MSVWARTRPTLYEAWKLEVGRTRRTAGTRRVAEARHSVVVASQICCLTDCWDWRPKRRIPRIVPSRPRRVGRRVRLDECWLNASCELSADWEPRTAPFDRARPRMFPCDPPSMRLRTSSVADRGVRIFDRLELSSVHAKRTRRR